MPAGGCPVCALPGTGGAVCGACLKRPPAFSETVAAFRYAFPVDILIQQLKYGGRTVAAAYLGDHLLARLEGRRRPDLILPMPLHPNRLRERGYNQAALLAGRLAGRLGVAMAPTLLRRRRDTPAQVGLPIEARRGNVRHAFACGADLGGARVALVDDVMTSGASLAELARVVKRAGAAEVSVWVVARALKV